MEKSIFLIENGSILYSSFFLIIFILILCMHGVSGVCRHGGIVVVVLPIAWTTVDRFLVGNVDRFLVGNVDQCRGVRFDQRRILCFVLSSTVACCDESWIINSSGGLLWIHGWIMIVVDVWIYERQAQLVGLHVAHCSYY